MTDITPLLGAVCKINSNGPEMTVDGWGNGDRLRVVWFTNGAFCEASVKPHSICLKMPMLAPDMLDSDRKALRDAHEAAVATLNRLKESA